MEQYAGLDVSLEQTSVCVVDGAGRVVREAKVASEPETLIAWFAAHGVAMTRIGLEAGPLSQWLFAAMEKAGLPVSLLETRHVRSAFKAMTIKTDRKDALGIAHLMRMGWFRPVHCKSLAAQEVRALLTARKLCGFRGTSAPDSEMSSAPGSEMTSAPDSEMTSAPHSEMTSAWASEMTSAPLLGRF